MIVGKPDFQKADEETRNMARACEYAREIGELDGKPLERILKNQLAILRSLDILLSMKESSP